MAKRKLEVTIIGDASNLKRALGSAGKDLDRFGGRAGKLSRGLATAGKIGGAAFAAGIAAGFAKAAKDTIAFDKAMRNVNSIAQLSEKELGKLQKQVLGLAGKTAQAPKVLAEGLYDLVSSGFEGKDALKVLEASAKAATAGLTTTEVSSKAVAAVLNAYKLPASDAAKVSDQLFRTVDRGVISFEELSQNVGDVLPFASSLGIGLDEVGASISTMTKAGISAPESMTRIKAAMQSFLKPSDAMSEALKSQGYESGEALVKAKGFQGALEVLAKTTGGSKQKMAALFPNVRALGGALALTGENAKGARKDLKGLQDSSGATEKALAQQSKSISFQWNKAKAALSAVGIQLGTKLVPIVAKAAGAIAKFVTQVSNGTGAGGRFASAISTAFNRVRSVVSSAVSAISGFLKRNKRDIEAIGKAFKSVGEFVIAVVKRIAPAVKQGFSGIVSIVKGVVKVVGSILRGDFAGAWKGIKGIITGALKLAVAGIRAFTAVMREAVARLGRAGWSAFKEGMSRLPGIALAALKGLPKAILSIRSKASDAVLAIVRAVQEMARKLVGWFFELGKDAIRGLIRGVKSMAEGAANAVGDVVEGAVDMATGILDIGSPSRVFHTIGEQVVQGFANGLSSSASIARAGLKTGLIDPISAAIEELQAERARLEESFAGADRKRERSSLIAAIRTARRGEMVTKGSGFAGGGSSSSSGGGGGAGLDWAKSMVGKFGETTGSNTGPGLDKLQKEFGHHAAAWCAMFATKALVKAGAPKELKTASVAQIRAWAQAGTHGLQKGVKKTPQVGDLMMFGNRHVGVVEKIVNGIVHTIEGNTSAGKVARRKHKASEGDFARVKGLSFGGSSGGGGGSKKSRLTPNEVRGLAYAVGFRGEALDTMVAIVMAESGGKVRASNRNKNGSIDRGLAQINSVHGKKSTFDPKRNLESAFSIWKAAGKSFKDWVTFNTGAFKKHKGNVGSGSGKIPGGVGEVTFRKVDKGAVRDAVQALKDFNREGARAAKLAAVELKIANLEKLKTYNDTVKEIRDSLEDMAKSAASSWRQAAEGAIEATLKSKLAAIATGAMSQELKQLQAAATAEGQAREDDANKRSLEDAERALKEFRDPKGEFAKSKARLDRAKASGNAAFIARAQKDHDALVRQEQDLIRAVEDVKYQIRETARGRRIDQLQQGITDQENAANAEADAARAGLDQQEADMAASLGTQLGMLVTNLETRKTAYRDFVKQVQAILGPYGQDFEGSGEHQSALSTNVPLLNTLSQLKVTSKGVYRRTASGKWLKIQNADGSPVKRAVGGIIRPGVVYRTGELGPEDIRMGRDGVARVRPASQSGAGGSSGGGGNVYIGTAHIGSQRAADSLAHRLAHRLAYS